MLGCVVGSHSACPRPVRKPQWQLLSSLSTGNRRELSGNTRYGLVDGRFRVLAGTIFAKTDSKVLPVSSTLSFRAVAMNRSDCARSVFFRPFGFVVAFGFRAMPSQSASEASYRSGACRRCLSTPARSARYRRRQAGRGCCTENRTQPNIGANASRRNAGRRPSCRA
jgi:hypothetical protein